MCMRRILKTTVTYALMGLAVGLCSEYAKSIYDDTQSTDFGDMAPEDPAAEKQEETTEINDTPTE